MVRVKMVFSYDGSKFYGFQRQNKLRNVQGELEKALSKILNESIIVKGAGRTDAGVHAIGQVVTFDTNNYMDNLKDLLNTELKDIVIKNVNIVSDEFHARYSAKGKIYLYKIKLHSKDKSNYCLCVNKVDLNLMKEASKLFVGNHDFRNFVSGERNNYLSYIKSIKFYRVFNYVVIRFEGVGFYRYMVRNIVGALIDVGKCKVTSEDIKNMLDHPEKRRQLSTALPNGLYLYKVLY